MKKIIQNNLFKVIFCGILFSSFGVALADDWVYQDPAVYGWVNQDTSSYQYNYNSYVNPTTDYVSTGCVGCTSAGSEWTYQNPSNYQYNFGSYINPTTDVVSTGCVGCSTDWTYQDTSSYQYNYNSYVNPTTDIVSTGCVGCNTYTTPSYTTSDCVGCNSYVAPTYTSSGCVGCDTYTTPTYTSTGCVGCGTYTTPTYTSTSCVGCGTYTSTDYGNTGYNYNTGSTFTGSTYNTGTSWTGYNYVGSNNTVISTTPTPTYVCPNGTTVSYASQCPVVTQNCPAGYTLVNGTCIPPQGSCPAGTTLINGVCQHPTTCPAGTTLVNGTCQVNTTVCPAGTTLVNGTCQINTTSCPTGTTRVNGVCQLPVQCPSGSTPINGVCQAPIVCPAGTTLQNGVCIGQGTTVCPAGSTLVNGICQINITSCPAGTVLINGICTINSTSCPAGTIFQNGSCFTNVTVCPSGTTLVNGICQVNTTYCPAGTYLQNGVCTSNTIVYQTCWDGSRIPNTSVCPSQYKVCPNGTSVPIYQVCYAGVPYPPYVPPQVVKFNNVVTSPVTEITNISARCNGIGLIANGAQSNGWFEYGETANLGRQTASTAIGSALTAPFSNKLTNLKPSTTYYCRAVMQNKYGTVKGEIVHFVTKAKVATYVKPVTVIKKTTTQVVKKNEIICSDGSIVTVGSQTTASMLNQGQKLISLQVEKVSGDLMQGATVMYRVTYQNLSDMPINGIVAKVTIPQDITYIPQGSGEYDPTSRTLTFTQSTPLAPNATGFFTWSGTVNSGAVVGKTVVATAYVAYTVPGTQVQDESTAYITGTIVSGSGAASSTGAKHVIGTGDRSFLPGSLVEWLALIAILFIIFILGRSIYVSYKDEDKHAH